LGQDTKSKLFYRESVFGENR